MRFSKAIKLSFLNVQKDQERRRKFKDGDEVNYYGNKGTIIKIVKKDDLKYVMNIWYYVDLPGSPTQEVQEENLKPI